MATRMVVVGGDAAGMSAAAQARRRRTPDDLAIVAFEASPHASYSACGLPYLAGRAVDDWEELVVKTPADFAERGITVELRHRVEAIDLDAGKIRVRDLEGGGERAEPFDILVMATGARPLRPDVPGIDLPGVHGLSVLQDGIDLRAAIDAGPRRAVVVGGGYIGLEAAEALVARGVATTMVERGGQVMHLLDADMAAPVADAVRAFGVELLLDEPVEAIEAGPDGRVAEVRTANRTLPADLVVLGLGTAPRVELAEAAGIPLGPSGAIAVDRRMRTSVEGVWAAGDCAETTNLVSGRPANYHLGTIANKQGRVCGINIGGGYASFPGVLGTAVTRLCDVEVARTGLAEKELDGLGFEARSVTVDSTTRAGYFPGAAPITVKLLAERGGGRLLGAQIVGREAAAKRIDTLATALWAGLGVHELMHADLAYAPPFSPVWDPVLIAARKLAELIDDDQGVY